MHHQIVQLAEELQTEPIWVINNGVAHGDSEWGGGGAGVEAQLRALAAVPAAAVERQAGRRARSDALRSTARRLIPALNPALPGVRGADIWPLVQVGLRRCCTRIHVLSSLV